MPTKCVRVITVVLFFLTASLVIADPQSGNNEYYNPLDLKIEFGFNSGYTSNLQLDSSDVEDYYLTPSVNLKFYPVSSMELVLFGDYTNYGKQFNLNSHARGIAFTFIPTRPDSRFSTYITGRFAGRTYKKDLRSFDNNNFNLITSVAYRLGRTVSIRTGILLESTSYLLSDTPDQDSYELFAGTNFTLFGSNSIDIEGGYSSMNYSFIRDDTTWIFPDENGSYDAAHSKGILNSFYISPRFSRPLGSSTGLSLMFHHRKFINGDNSVVLGSAVNFISPWGNIYEGQAYTLNLKTIVFPKMIISVGFGYWKKAYLKTMIRTDYAVYYAEKRHDEQNRFFAIFERPIYLKGGGVLKPKLQIDLIHNNTTSFTMFDLYDFSGFTVNASLTYEL